MAQWSDQAVNEILNQRLPHYHKNFPLMFFWSQKGGCTSLAKIEQDYGLTHSPLKLISESVHHNSAAMTRSGNASGIVFSTITDSLPTYASFYDKEALNLAEHVFRKDIVLYGYHNKPI